MPNQLYPYYIENPLVSIYINGGSWWVIVIGLDIEIWVIGKGHTKKRGREKGWMGVGRGLAAAGFCDPCACLYVFLLL
jgi:hypothetical protein